MSDIKFEKEICAMLEIPCCPKKEWDNKTPFERGVALLRDITGTEMYAVCTYNPEIYKKVRITKVFGSIPFSEILSVYPIPAYMEDDITKMDLDESSKEAMEDLLREKAEITNKDVEVPNKEIYEWGYSFITNKQEAIAFLKTKNVRGKIPTNEEVLKAKLKVMFNKENNK